jgi:ubiquinone biosynthesis UbiH/UbiF/VisC/COQ6 family hydroxylase
MDAEVVIVGAGPAGSSLAASLADCGVSSALIDPRREIAAPGTGFDARVYALRPASVSFLKRCGIWNNVDGSRVCPIHEMRVSGDDGVSVLRFDAYEAGLAELAVIAEDANLQRAARVALESKPLVTLLAGRSVVDARWSEGQVELMLDDGSKVCAQLAVAADGADSRLRALAGIEIEMRPYRQRALVANFRAGKPHRCIAFQWFRDDGVLALLPLPGNQVSMVWSTAQGNAETLLALEPRELARRVGEASRHELDELSLCTAVSAFPLRLMRSCRIVAPRLVMVGDAAHNVHPLAGQGLNLGLADSEALAGTIARRLPAESIASAPLLARYRRARAEEVAAMRFVTDGLQRLFEARSPGVKWLRNSGLRLVDRLAPVKNDLVKRAIGRMVQHSSRDSKGT